MEKVFLLIVLGFAGIWAPKAEAQVFECKKQGAVVCARDRWSPQCLRSWDTRRNPHAQQLCQNYIQGLGRGLDKSTSSCRKNATGACLVNNRTGNCTMEWHRRDYYKPLDACLRFLGVKGPPRRVGFYCVRTGAGYCAVDPKTRQCARSWDQRAEAGMAHAACERYIRRL